jgi:flagellar biosynthesis/type III secretory pathway protein FliH
MELKMKKYIVLIMATAFLGTGCKDKYAEGFAAGETQGVADGRVDGYNQGSTDGYNSVFQVNYDTGFADGKVVGHANGYSEGEAYYTTNDNYGNGFSDGWDQSYGLGETDGKADGYELGYNTQYAVGYANGVTPGLNDGLADGFSDGYDTGATDGYNDGYTDGESVEYSIGYNDGYSDGDVEGYSNAYSVGYDEGFIDGEVTGFSSGEIDGAADGEIDGYDAGYDVGFDDGYDATLGLSTKSSNPSVKLAAMVNADLIDYSNLQKFDSKSAVSSMALSHADNATVDMEKLAALKEQHYLNQMAVQLNAKFGLSGDRARQVAKVAHQFNKLAGTRELTEKDANVFAVEVIGKNMKEVEVAVKESMNGNSALLDEVLATIGTTNGLSSENTMEIITTIFN